MMLVCGRELKILTVTLSKRQFLPRVEGPLSLSAVCAAKGSFDFAHCVRCAQRLSVLSRETVGIMEKAENREGHGQAKQSARVFRLSHNPDGCYYYF